MSTKPHNRRGKFIVFEGLDKAGKSTQCTRLISNLKSRGHNVESLRFPDRTTPIGRLIDDFLRGSNNTAAAATSANTNKQEKKEPPSVAPPPTHTPSDQAIHLLFSANRWEHAAAIESTLASGTSIICDRYYYSGCVYSAAKGIPGLDLAWARSPDVGLPRPDLCLLLDVSADVAMKRAATAAAASKHTHNSGGSGGSGGSAQLETGQERYEVPAMQARVRELFGELRSGGGGSGGGGGGGRADEADDIVVVDASGSVEEVEGEILRRVLRVFEDVDAAAAANGGDGGSSGGAPLRRIRAW